MSLTTQHIPLRRLLCSGPEEHVCPMPDVHSEGATGKVVCSECGAPMILVDVILVERNTSWASLSDRRRDQRRYWS